MSRCTILNTMYYADNIEHKNKTSIITSSYLISKKLNTSCETLDSLILTDTPPQNNPWTHPG